MQPSIVITTIQALTDPIRKFSVLLPEWPIILVGDRKTPTITSNDHLCYLSIEDQKKLGFSLADQLPLDHYVRKNLGYLYSLKEYNGSVYDTDDDNTPYDDWSFPVFRQERIDTISGAAQYNVYRSFTDENIWPRGFPLSRLAMQESVNVEAGSQHVGVWQGLADLDPDVDAIHRLVFNQKITFEKRAPFVLQQGCYCPFNSQNTLWDREMLAYAYLPASVSFRYTDILRGYIAQRCLWEHGRKLGFTRATVFQDRNSHDLMKDFESEIPVYLHTERVMKLLDDVTLRADWAFNLVTIYRKLRAVGVVQESELKLLSAWIKDIEPYM